MKIKAEFKLNEKMLKQVKKKYILIDDFDVIFSMEEIMIENDTKLTKCAQTMKEDLISCIERKSIKIKAQIKEKTI